VASVTFASVPEISGAVLQSADTYRDTFLHAEPFKHVVIENFFEPSFAEKLLADFPSFDLKLATNEFGLTGKKAVNTNIRTISPVYQELYRLISEEPFLDLVSRLSRIPDLILDPKMYGGGTHDNQHGQELDPHVDFNYDEAQKLHRRLNLIVYLNKDWKTEWGGALEIHSNPREPAANRITSYDPLFNRCVMFETNERSWHGFPRIDLPAEKRHLSRKSISIYLYTKDRPAEEIAPMHGTFYVQRPLATHIAEGHTLTAQDVENIQKLLTVRDGWIKAYQHGETEKNREIANKARVIQELKSHALAPLTGYVLQEGSAAGFHGDGWVASHAELQVRALLPVSELVLRGFRPERYPRGRIRVSAGELASAESALHGGTFELKVQLPQPVPDSFLVRIDFEPEAILPVASAEERDLAFVMVELSARHPESARLIEWQDKLSREEAKAQERIQELEVQLAAAAGLGAELENKCRELAQCVEHLHAAERTAEERTAWAQRGAAEIESLRSLLHTLRSNPWVRLAGKLRLLPKPGNPH
jgi:hypothetical protein